jgi:SpoVK/Ycf46/Vps4 family AAA+-type ATPase
MGSPQTTTGGGDRERFGRLLAAGHGCISIVTFEESDALDLVRTCAMDSAMPCWQWSINRGLTDGLVADMPAIADTEHPAAALYWLSIQDRPCMTILLDLAGHLKDERTLRLLRELIVRYEKLGGHLVLIDHREELPPVVKSVAAGFELSLPDEVELLHVVRDTLRQRGQERPVRVELTRQQSDILLQALRGLSRRQVRRILCEAVAIDRQLDINDLSMILSEKRRAMQGEGVLDYIESPVSLDEIGGLRRLKFWLTQRQEAQSKSAAEFGLPAPRGILMLGVQGAGKSLAAKAVATAWRWPLLRLDAGALYDRYIGESERRLRESLRQAERMAPVILWIDEIEKAFASAASQSTDGGVSRRMFGSMLTWMQEHAAPVFVIATANDIEALPPELLRKGRFDEIFFVDLPVKESRSQIFAIHLRKRKRDPGDFNLDALSDAADGFSGAEIEQAVVAAMHDAFAHGRELSTDGILAALQNSPPLSVTMAEKVADLRAWAEGRCVPAD